MGLSRQVMEELDKSYHIEEKNRKESEVVQKAIFNGLKSFMHKQSDSNHNTVPLESVKIAYLELRRLIYQNTYKLQNEYNVIDPSYVLGMIDGLEEANLLIEKIIDNSNASKL